jgi:hypothetical protein
MESLSKMGIDFEKREHHFKEAVVNCDSFLRVITQYLRFLKSFLSHMTM